MTAVGEMTLPVGLTFVGTAGTITSLAAMAQQLPTYEPARIHNYRLARSVVEELESTLLARTKSEQWVCRDWKRIARRSSLPARSSYER